MDEKRVLISGGGIAGLTLAIELKKAGYAPLVIEREPTLRTEGYMMDFFGTGWGVAERMGLIKKLRAVKYPIDALEFSDADGKAFLRVPVERIRAALDDKYVYVRRPDLERVLAERARKLGVEIRYGAALVNITDKGDAVAVRFEDGTSDSFGLVFGADGQHSRVRRLVFGLEQEFSRFLGLYVAAFHAPIGNHKIARAAKIFEQTDRMALFFPLDSRRMDAVYIFRHPPINVPSDRRIAFTRERFRDAGGIAGEVLQRTADDEPVYFDSATQIVMPEWYRGRVALVGDACGCLTLIAGQGAHMAMAGGYILAQELSRHTDHTAAFAAYQAFLKPMVEKKQKDAARFARIFVPAERSRPWLRRLGLRLFFSKLTLRYALKLFGAENAIGERAKRPQ
jgi:2-polyprenyl-6-methoxyphenol hydroxylase-like FAD-dependent oxidoreductase